MLIAFEGGEGSGKGTQLKLLEPTLIKEGYDVEVIIEPGGTPAGQAIRDILLHRKDLKMLGITEAFLFSASRAQQVRAVTRLALDAGKLVLSDRSYYSTYAYQGYGRRGDLKLLEKLTDIAVEETRPDLVILLDLPPKVGIARKKSQKEVNRLDAESLEFHDKVREGYLTMAKEDPNLWKIIDATNSIEEVQKDILATIKQYLK